MGFDFWITLNFDFNRNTGLPCLFGTQNEGKYFQIPEKWRDFIDMSYSHMRYYVCHFDGNSTSMLVFYDHFPAWEDVKHKIQDEDWTEDVHNEFEEFVEWCAEMGSFQANWEPC